VPKERRRRLASDLSRGLNSPGDLMDFFAQQEKARTRTAWLVFLFATSVMLIVIAVNVASVAAFAMFRAESGKSRLDKQVDPPPLPTEFHFWVSAGTLLLISAGSLYKMRELGAGGGEAVARMFDGKFVNHSTSQESEKVLSNVVEEMAIASGVSPPRIYLIDSPSINAFAAGDSVNGAVIGVTQGCLNRLSRQELQGVIAHEFSHILNGDMKTNLRLVGLLHGILLLSITGRILLRTAARSGGDRNSGQVKIVFFIVGLSLFLIGYIGVFFGKLIKSAISRQREFLADASAVQFTRDPGGIHGALRKIMDNAHGAYIDNPSSEEVAHLFFGNALSKTASNSAFVDWLTGWMSTHPPLDQRMERILPRPAAVSAPGVDSREGSEISEAISTHPSPFLDNAPLRPTANLGATVSEMPPSLESGIIESCAGTVTREKIDAARSWKSSLSPEISQCLKTPQQASSLILAILLSRTPQAFRDSLLASSPEVPHAIWEASQRLIPSMEKIPRTEILPLVDLALSTVRELPSMDLSELTKYAARFNDHAHLESTADYMVSSMIRARLIPANVSLDPHSGDLSRQMRDIRTVLSALAHEGGGEIAAREAYAAAVGKMESDYRAESQGIALLSSRRSEMIPASEISIHKLDKALFALRSTHPKMRKSLLRACQVCMEYDKVLGDSEKELFRAIAAVLDCPIPPDLSKPPGSGSGLEK